VVTVSVLPSRFRVRVLASSESTWQVHRRSAAPTARRLSPSLRLRLPSSVVGPGGGCRATWTQSHRRDGSRCPSHRRVTGRTCRSGPHRRQPAGAWHPPAGRRSPQAARPRLSGPGMGALPVAGPAPAAACRPGRDQAAPSLPVGARRQGPPGSAQTVAGPIMPGQ
jgi:hypothetical protein